MRKANLKDLFSVVNTRRWTQALFVHMGKAAGDTPRAETEVAHQVRGVTIDEMVYSKDLRYYERRSYFLERIMPFSRVFKTALEPTNVAVDPAAFIIGGIHAANVDFQFRPRHDYSKSVLIIC